MMKLLICGRSLKLLYFLKCGRWTCGDQFFNKVLQPATSTQVFLGFPVSISKRSDGSQHSKLPLHASHVAPRLKFISNQFHVLFTCKITTATG